MRTAKATIVSGQSPSGAKPSADIKPAAKAQSLGNLITDPRYSGLPDFSKRLLVIREGLRETQEMNILLIASLLAVNVPAPIVGPLPPALTLEQAARLKCVAGLAIIANEQSRGVGGWEDIQNLSGKGAKFAALVGEALMKDSGRTREMVRSDMIAAVAALQTEGATSAEPDSMLRDLVQPCVAMMEAALPPPSFPTCAAMLSLAYDEVYKREGLSKTAKDLATFAAVLNSRAREELRADGKSEVETDMEMGKARAAVEAQTKRTRSNEGLDFEACFELARP